MLRQWRIKAAASEQIINFILFWKVLQNLSTIYEEAETELAESGDRNDP